MVSKRTVKMIILDNLLKCKNCPIAYEISAILWVFILNHKYI